MSAGRALWSAFRSPRYPACLLAATLLWLGLWSLGPQHPFDFALEHLLTVAFLALLVWSRRRFPLSHVSYTLIALFLALHIVGAFYTYSEVPYERWIATVGGWLGAPDASLDRLMGWKRNMYDRLVHFSFGLLLAYPAREIFVRIARVKGFWGYYLPLDVMMSLSMMYELLEWGVAVVVGGDTGQSYLGTQGDEWDAHKDMFLASVGALLAMVGTALVNAKWQRDFAREFADSLSATGDGPLGEAKLEEMLDGRKG